MLFEYVEKKGIEPGKEQDGVRIGETFDEVMETVRKDKMGKMCPYAECSPECKMKTDGTCDPVRLAARAPKQTISRWNKKPKSLFDEAGDLGGLAPALDDPGLVPRSDFRSMLKEGG